MDPALPRPGMLSPAQERRYKELKDELIKAVKSLSLNQNRIDSLVEQLYDITQASRAERRPPAAPGRKLRREA